MTQYIKVGLAALNMLNKPALHSDDRSVPGMYLVEIDGTLPKEKWANAALDVFHSKVPVKNLDDFRFVATEYGTSMVLPVDPDHEDYSCANGGDVNELLSMKRLHVYEVTVEAIASDCSKALVGSAQFLAPSKSNAATLALKVFWDTRYDAAHCRARIKTIVKI